MLRSGYLFAVHKITNGEHVNYYTGFVTLLTGAADHDYRLTWTLQQYPPQRSAFRMFVSDFTELVTNQIHLPIVYFESMIVRYPFDASVGLRLRDFDRGDSPIMASAYLTTVNYILKR